MQVLKEPEGIIFYGNLAIFLVWLDYQAGALHPYNSKKKDQYGSHKVDSPVPLVKIKRIIQLNHRVC
jgi:hypothetical protein